MIHLQKLTLAIAALGVALSASAGAPRFGDIRNDCFWDTAEGEPLYSQGGGIFRFPDPETGKEKYYWYGARYDGAEQYRRDPSVTIKDAVFSGVTCYTSDNLTDWHYAGDALTPEEIRRHGQHSWVGRLGVARIPGEEGYVLVVQCDNGVLFASSPTPAGDFKWQWRKDMTPTIGTPNTGDQTVFTDPDTGISYLVYSYGNGRNKIYISEIGMKDGRPDLLDCTQVFAGESREGNCMFKHGGKYYMCASNIYGWDGSYAYYLVADDIRGPYTPLNDMQPIPGCEDDYAHISQTGFFYTLRHGERETVVYCGDRWSDFAGNGLGYNQWVPLSFSDDGTPWFNSLSSWALCEATGEWKVNDDNDYVRNGSFEADRRSVPNPVKPRQDFLHGWTTEVIEGTPVAVGDSLSPKLNHMNSREDRLHVVGEKSLCISDRGDFKRRVSQKVESTPHVALPDGTYTLRAMMRTSGHFPRLEMGVESRGGEFKTALPASPAWTPVEIDGIRIKGGKAEISIYAEGCPEAECLIDDISLKPAPK